MWLAMSAEETASHRPQLTQATATAVTAAAATAVLSLLTLLLSAMRAAAHKRRRYAA